MTLSKLSTKRAPLLLVCLAASLLPVLFSSLWMDKRLNPDSTTIMLLAVICLGFWLDWGLSWKNSPKARQVKFSETDVCPSPPFFPVPKNKLNLYTREALRLYPKTLTISCFLVLAARDCQCRSEEHTSELQSRPHLVCRLLLEKKKKTKIMYYK